MVQEKLAQAWFGKITPDNVTPMINVISMAWYLYACAIALDYVFVIFTDHRPAGILQGPLLYALGAFFLRARKSRSIAVLLCISAFLQFVMLGLFDRQSFGAVVASFLMFPVAWRGIKATWIHHHATGRHTSWKDVVLVLSLMFLLILSAFIVTHTIAPGRADDPSSYNVFGGAIILLLLFAMVPLTRRFPFAVQKPQSPERDARPQD